MRVENTNGCNCAINKLQKSKPILFTTEDGVEIKKGDTWFYIQDKDGSWEIYQNNGEYSKLVIERISTFSTRAKAEEYVLMNKPCLSVNDASKIIGHRISQLDSENLITLAKSRL